MDFLIFLVCLVVAGIMLALKLKSTPQSIEEEQSEPSVTIRRVPPGQWVEEVLLDRDGYYYGVRRGEARTYVSQNRPGTWRDILEDVPVVGTKHRPESVAKFLAARTPWLELEREPTNPVDRNAIKVNVVIDAGDGRHETVHMGYLPAETAALIAKEVPPGMPMTVDLTSYAPSTKDEGGASVYCMILIDPRWCPLCKGDLGRVPRKPGTCKSCGGAFDFSPKLGLVVPK